MNATERSARLHKFQTCYGVGPCADKKAFKPTLMIQGTIIDTSKGASRYVPEEEEKEEKEKLAMSAMSVLFDSTDHCGHRRYDAVEVVNSGTYAYCMDISKDACIKVIETEYAPFRSSGKQYKIVRQNLNDHGLAKQIYDAIEKLQDNDAYKLHPAIIQKNLRIVSFSSPYYYSLRFPDLLLTREEAKDFSLQLLTVLPSGIRQHWATLELYLPYNFHPIPYCQMNGEKCNAMKQFVARNWIGKSLLQGKQNSCTHTWQGRYVAHFCFPDTNLLYSYIHHCAIAKDYTYFNEFIYKEDFHFFIDCDMDAKQCKTKKYFKTFLYLPPLHFASQIQETLLKLSDNGDIAPLQDHHFTCDVLDASSIKREKKSVHVRFFNMEVTKQEAKFITNKLKETVYDELVRDSIDLHPVTQDITQMRMRECDKCDKGDDGRPQGRPLLLVDTLEIDRAKRQFRSTSKNLDERPHQEICVDILRRSSLRIESAPDENSSTLDSTFDSVLAVCKARLLEVYEFSSMFQLKDGEVIVKMQKTDISSEDLKDFLKMNYFFVLGR